MDKKDKPLNSAMQVIREKVVKVEKLDDLLQLLLHDKKFNLDLLHSRLLYLMGKQSDEEVEDEKKFKEVVFVEILELLLCSGYVQEHRWVSAINILTTLINLDSYNIHTNPYALRLSVAVALSFSTDIKSLASYQTKRIDPIERYFSIKEFSERNILFPVHRTLNTWLLRYVVSSWCEPSDFLWAQQNIHHDFRTADKVGESTHEMLQYKEHNNQGISIHDGAAFYDHNPCTLKVLQEYGAVCGGVSKFGVAMAQAFGIPACPIGQPGHCAFLWLKNGEWVMSNGISGITNSNAHGGIQWTWHQRCDYQILCHQAMKYPDKYIKSEKLRLVCKHVRSRKLQIEVLDHAVETCPHNYLLWRDSIRFLDDLKKENFGSDPPTMLNADIDQWAEEALKKLTLDDQVLNDEVLSQVHHNVSLKSNVMEYVENLVDGTDSEWYCKEPKAWIEIDLGRICTVSTVEIQWWGISVSKKYKIYASPDKDDDSHSSLVATHSSEIQSPTGGYNEWSKLPGWDGLTRKIKFVFKEGQKDIWGKDVLIGIRQIRIIGQEKEDLTTMVQPLERYLIKNVQKTLGKDFPQIGKDLLKYIHESGSTIISGSAIISTISGQELALNLLDGTDSEWWTTKKRATIELDLRGLYHVSLFEIQWWGISFAASFSVSVAIGDGEDERFVEVMTHEDCFEHPADRDTYNEWSKGNGWEHTTRKVRIHMNDGFIDPWFEKYQLGARKIQITGYPVR